jgi:PTS system nitrogen regulatory IIA component
VSIPHARLRELKKPFGLLARLKRPLEYQAIDGEPVDIVFMLLLPAFSQLEQLNALAVVARKLRDQGVLERLRRAANAVELYRAITA